MKEKFRFSRNLNKDKTIETDKKVGQPVLLKNALCKALLEHSSLEKQGF